MLFGLRKYVAQPTARFAKLKFVKIQNFQTNIISKGTYTVKLYQTMLDYLRALSDNFLALLLDRWAKISVRAMFMSFTSQKNTQKSINSTARSLSIYAHVLQWLHSTRNLHMYWLLGTIVILASLCQALPLAYSQTHGDRSRF